MIDRPISCENPAASVVVPTIPRHSTARLEERLSHQTVGGFELLLVNDASINRSEARNEGIDAANAPLLLFTDDDTEPPPEWVETAISVFQENPDTVLLEGPLDRYAPGPRHYIGANIAVRRDAALEVGGFDPAFAGWREDTDFGWRIEDQYGIDRCRYCPAWENNHPDQLRGAEDAELEKQFRQRHLTRFYDVFFVATSMKGRSYLFLRRQLERLGVPGPPRPHKER